MNPITCIIVDDEPLAVKLLESFVQKTPQLQLEHSFTDSVEAFAWLKDHPVSLAFMDIQMPDLNGMELSRMLPEGTKVIFTTAFKEYAFESYEVSAVDFLLKPIRYNKFIAAVEKAEHLISLECRVEDLENAGSAETVQKKTMFIRVDGELQAGELRPSTLCGGHERLCALPCGGRTAAADDPHDHEGGGGCAAYRYLYAHQPLVYCAIGQDTNG